MMKLILAAVLVCFLTVFDFAQGGGKIKGVVTDGRSPLVANTVILSSGNNQIATTTTDSEGRFSFENVGKGKYQISVAGRQDGPAALVKVDVVDTVTNIDIDVSKSNASIRENVTVSAGESQTVEQVSKTVNIIDGQEMRDRADFTLTDTLRSIPGFRIQQLGGFGRLATIKTRGLRNQDTAILIDGIRFRDASAITGDASSFLSDFTLTSVDRIEVLRGSGSSLYGTNAIGGTINFETPKPTAGPHGQIGGAYGQLGLERFRGSFSDGTSNGKFGYNVAVSRTAYTRGIDGQDNAHNTNFQSRLEYDPFSKTNVSARFYVSDAYVRLNSSPDTILGGIPNSNAVIVDAEPGITLASDVNDPDSFQRSKFFDAQVSLTQILNSRLVFQGYYSGLKTSRKNDNGILGVGFQSPSTSVFDGTIQTANAHFNWTPDPVNTVTAGYEFEHEKYGNDGFTPNGSGNFFLRAFQTSHTFYAQDLLSLFKDRLQLAGGIRAQVFDLKTPTFSLVNAPYTNLTLGNPPTAYTFDGAASYYLSKTRTKLRAHVGNGYRVPSLFERFGTFFSTFPSNSFVALGDPNLKPEKTIAVDGGIEQGLFRDRAKLTATYFYTKLIDTISFGNVVPNIGPTGRPFGGYENTKGGIARGIELSGTVKATDSTDLFASYTFTNSDQRQPQVTGNPNIETLGIPKSQFTLVATQRVQRFWVNFDLLISDSYLAPIFDTNNFSFQTYVFRFKGNRRGDLTAGYTFPLQKDKMNLRLYGTMENVFNYQYFENGFRTPGRNSRVGLSFGF